MCDLRGTWLRGSIAPYLGTRCRKRGRSNRGRTSPGSPSTSSLESPSERLPGDSLAFRLLLEGLREFQESGLSPSENDEVAYLLREEIGALGDVEVPPDSSRERQLSLRRDLHDLSHRRHVRNPYHFNLVPGMVTSLSESNGYPWRFSPLPVDGTPMSNAQDMDDPLLPVDIDDSPVVVHSNLEGFNGSQTSQVSSRIQCNRPELSGHSLPDGFVQFPELFRCEFRELNPECQPLIPLSSVALAGRSFPPGFVGATRRYLRWSSRSSGPLGRARSHTGRIRTSKGSPVPWTPPQAASPALS